MAVGALFLDYRSVSADCRRRLRFLETTLKADAPAPAEVAQKVKFLAFKEGVVLFVEGFQVEDEVAFAFVQHDRADINGGAVKVDERLGLDKPPVQYVDSAYISAQKLVQAQAEGRELIGPALPGPQKEDRFRVSDFQINLAERHATCPAGKLSTQCSRLVEQSSGKDSDGAFCRSKALLKNPLLFSRINLIN
ncbi:MAG: hypothetical protein WCT12_24625 [Verrucomicrobiota bacterium]